MKALSGYSTYIIIVMLVILNGLHYFGINVPGFTSIDDPGNLISVLLALWRARAGARNDAAKALAAANTAPPVTTVSAAKQAIAGTK